ncbi:Stromal cell-derived factor 2-like protein 1 [Physocladia obscura]|uniref:Stromal cell-derived factor 2-like protein 1 n=1 Tax=Physocladia obscura TaxID=109957 RepID=A0AAD5T1Z9_9FUNG|nr:Stromal cell-derived factor 2-like protein 1 [Physocladia obscura]
MKINWNFAVAFLTSTTTPSAAATGDDAGFVIEKEFEAVTCGSSVKLAHSASQFRLHSHQITYGTGSGQQSVTGMNSADDTNSLWIVEGAFGSSGCPRGTPVKCSDVVRWRFFFKRVNFLTY